jgi:two-component system, LuxR family, sensor kinase FixL
MAAKRRTTRKQEPAACPREPSLVAYAEALGRATRHPFLVCDENLRIQSVNAAFCRAFRLAPEEVCNCSLYELNGGDWDIPELRETLERVVCECAAVDDFPLNHAFRHLGPRILRLNARRLGWTGGRLALIALGIEDLTEHTVLERTARQCRQCDARLQAIVATATDAILLFDAAGMILGVNPAAERMFLHTAEQLIGQSAAMLLPPAYRAEFDAHFRGWLESQAKNGQPRETVVRRKDGALFPVELTLSQVNEEPLFAAILRDISERKALQQEILSACESQQRHFGQQLHDDVGQELTGLALKAETLADALDQWQGPERKLAADIVGAIDRTRTKVRALVSGQLAGEVEREGLLAALEELASRASALYSISCTFAAQTQVPVAETHTATQLYHIAQEAIHNGVRHGHAQHIEVSLDASESIVILKVRDDGVGIPPPHQRGKGMGLSIMRYRADLIGGTLNIKPWRPRGTLVTCNVPRRVKPE